MSRAPMLKPNIVAPAITTPGSALIPNSGSAVSAATIQITWLPVPYVLSANARVCCSRCCAPFDCVAAGLTSLFVADRSKRMQIRARTRMPARCRALGIVKSKNWVKGLDIMFYGRESISLGVARQARRRDFLAGEELCNLPDVVYFLCPSRPCQQY